MLKLPARAVPANMVLRVLLCNRRDRWPGTFPAARRGSGLSAWLVALLVAGLAAGLTTAAESKRPLRIVVLGDSLVAGFGLKATQAFPAQLERALTARGQAVEVVNAGVSGDTTAGGLERVSWAVPEGTDAVIVELGANDALRGLPPTRAAANLERIIAICKARGAEVLLAGMLAPRNMGQDYVRAFDAIYPELAAKTGVLLYPFFLDGVALDPKLTIGDGLHPNDEGVRRITQRILPLVERLIASVGDRQERQ
jgi:acyl-CoA thioesterase-1